MKGERSHLLSHKERVDLRLFPWKPDWRGMPAVISNNSASGKLGREDYHKHLRHKGGIPALGFPDCGDSSDQA